MHPSAVLYLSNILWIPLARIWVLCSIVRVPLQDQGDTQSLITWIIYNLLILQIFQKLVKKTELLYVDDATALVTGADFHITHNKLRDIMNHKGGILEWAKSHNYSFGIKFQLVDLSQWKIQDPLQPCVKYLSWGRKLRWSTEGFPRSWQKGLGFNL